jgi:hypothetical protein
MSIRRARERAFRGTWVARRSASASLSSSDWCCRASSWMSGPIIAITSIDRNRSEDRPEVELADRRLYRSSAFTDGNDSSRRRFRVDRPSIKNSESSLALNTTWRAAVVWAPNVKVTPARETATLGGRGWSLQAGVDGRGGRRCCITAASETASAAHTTT